MPRSRVFSLRLLGFIATVLCAANLAPLHAETPAPAKKPNILFILCDDLGYGDIGVFFQKQRQEKGDRNAPWELTPHVDALANGGIQLRGYYCPAPVCAPSRASLLLGVHQGHANVRDNQFDKALEDNHTLATVLRQGGYATAAIGKYGLQGVEEKPGKINENEDAPRGKKEGNPATWSAYPTKRGFDFYFGYVRHVDGHEHYPKEGLHKQGPKQVWDNEREISQQLDKCYTADLFTARAKKWIADHQAAHADQPFFMYLAYDTPHATIELPTGPYPAGGGLHGGLQWTGQPGAMINTANGTVDSYYYPEFAQATLANGDVWPEVYRRYASCVRRIDDCVEDLRQLLIDLKIDRDTLVVFTSDNGPSQESYLPEKYEPTFFHGFGPFDGIKRDCWEGGVRVGAIASWPGVIPAAQISEAPIQAHDWMPTFADFAGLPAPARTDGVSLRPTLTHAGYQSPSTIYVEYFVAGKTPSYDEFEARRRGAVRKQMQLIRLGDLLGVRYDVKSHADPFEIYDVVKDPKETTNLAEQNAALQQQMKDEVLRLRRPNESAPRPYDRELVPALANIPTQQGIAWQLFMQHYPWTPKLDGQKCDRSGLLPRLEIASLPLTEDGAVLATGFIDAPQDGDYTFSLRTDGGALLRLHGATIIDADFGYVPGSERTGSVRLQAGKHPFRLYYKHDHGREPQLDLRWSGPGFELQSIAEKALSLPKRHSLTSPSPHPEKASTDSAKALPWIKVPVGIGSDSLKNKLEIH